MSSVIVNCITERHGSKPGSPMSIQIQTLRRSRQDLKPSESLRSQMILTLGHTYNPEETAYLVDHSAPLGLCPQVLCPFDRFDVVLFSDDGTVKPPVITARMKPSRECHHASNVFFPSITPRVYGIGTGRSNSDHFNNRSASNNESCGCYIGQ